MTPPPAPTSGSNGAGLHLLPLVAGAAGVSLLGLVHATAAGAGVLAGLHLAAPGLVDVPDPGRAVAYAVTFGLGSLRVPLESADFQGVFAPLSGLIVTLWGVASGVRRSAPSWPGRRPRNVAAVAVAFAATCAAAAAIGGAVGPVDASIPGAAIAGLVWGAVAATWATRPGDGTLAAGGRPSVAPGLTGAAVALGLAGAWFVVALVVVLAGAPAREVAGGIVLGLGAAPNAAAALAAVGLGAPVDAVLDGTVFGGPVGESLSLWDWAGRFAPPHVASLVLVPLVASIVGGRLAEAATPHDPPVLRGLRNGTVLGGVLVAVGWAGELAVTAAGQGEPITFRLGFSPLVVLVSAILWGIVGAYAGPRIPRRRSRALG